MMTEAKLRTALNTLDRRLLQRAHGRPMSGLSIPADYYFSAKNRPLAKVVRSRKPARIATGK